VQQLGSARLSGPTMFAHGQQTVFKSYIINKVMVEKIIDLARSVIAGNLIKNGKREHAT
jgi:hypothetical protein